MSLHAPTLSSRFRPFSLASGALLLAAATSLSACNLQISMQAEGRSEWKKSYTLAPGGSLEIRNTNGLIEIDPSEGDAVTVTAERIAKGATDADAQKTAEGIEIKESASPSSIILDARTNTSGIVLGSRQVKFHVHAPKGAALTFSTTNGTIEVRDMTGELRLETTNGRIGGRGLAGATRAQTTNGVIELDYAAIGGTIAAETTNGKVDLALPSSAKAQLNVRVTNGSISSENLTLQTTESSRRRLSGTLNGGGPEVRVETTNGSVSLRGK